MSPVSHQQNAHVLSRPWGMVQAGSIECLKTNKGFYKFRTGTTFVYVSSSDDETYTFWALVRNCKIDLRSQPLLVGAIIMPTTNR